MKTLKVRNITFGEGIPKICVPLTCGNEKELPPEIERALQEEPDVLEFRADLFCNVFTRICEDGVRCAASERIGELMRRVREQIGETVLLFTWRTAPEGGSSPEEDQCYPEILSAALTGGAVDLIDIELRHPERKRIREEARRRGVPVILSEHDFHRTPGEEEILRSLKEMEINGADIAKIAVMPSSVQDVRRLAHAAKEAFSYAHIPIIAIAMGEYGKETRIRAEEIGSCLTFGSVGGESAPGQIPVRELHKLLLAFHKEFV
ncbi:MAG: type I 3-dehydroquinate dehydratase [Lachnospiraceae bacterium]|nr:type I 3-dehydroquinate dehydratase [Lachnospiraceae bacterium]